MTEAEIQKDVIRYLELQGYLVFRMNAGQAKNNVKMAPAGTPDLMAVGQGLLRGQVLWIEVKGPRGKVSADQADMIKRLRMAGQDVRVVRGVDSDGLIEDAA